MQNRIEFTGTPDRLDWSLLLPEGWALTDVMATGAVEVPADGTMDLAEWSWTAPAASPIEFEYRLNPGGARRGRTAIAALVTRVEGAETLQSVVHRDPLYLRYQDPRTHAGDTNGDWRLSLSELLRVIELYNTRSGSARLGAYRVWEDSIDGFASAAEREGRDAPEMARYHSADTDRDGRLSLSELLRVIELYNQREGTARTGRYHATTGTPDGFSTGPE